MADYFSRNLDRLTAERNKNTRDAEVDALLRAAFQEIGFKVSPLYWGRQKKWAGHLPGGVERRQGLALPPVASAPIIDIS